MELPSGPSVILALKIAVGAVTLLLGLSLWALARGNYRLHGQLNVLFYTLTVVAVIVFEGVRMLGVDLTAHMDAAARTALLVHLCFVIPLLPVMTVMLYTGLRRRGKVHVG